MSDSMPYPPSTKTPPQPMVIIPIEDGKFLVMPMYDGRLETWMLNNARAFDDMETAQNYITLHYARFFEDQNEPSVNLAEQVSQVRANY